MRLFNTSVNGVSSVVDTSNLNSDRYYQACISGTGAVSANILFEGSVTGSLDWVPLGQIVLSGTIMNQDTFRGWVGYKYIRATVSNISSSSLVYVDIGET